MKSRNPKAARVSHEPVKNMALEKATGLHEVALDRGFAPHDVNAKVGMSIGTTPPPIGGAGLPAFHSGGTVHKSGEYRLKKGEKILNEAGHTERTIREDSVQKLRRGQTVVKARKEPKAWKERPEETKIWGARPKHLPRPDSIPPVPEGYEAPGATGEIHVSGQPAGVVVRAKDLTKSGKISRHQGS